MLHLKNLIMSPQFIAGAVFGILLMLGLVYLEPTLNRNVILVIFGAALLGGGVIGYWPTGLYKSKQNVRNETL
jgi:ABC-type uncharacterized transport system permease subunit